MPDPENPVAACREIIKESGPVGATPEFAAQADSRTAPPNILKLKCILVMPTSPSPDAPHSRAIQPTMEEAGADGASAACNVILPISFDQTPIPLYCFP